MESIEMSGRTVEEAVQAALQQLGMTEAQVDIEILKSGKPGILGLGAEEAKVLVRPRQPINTNTTKQQSPSLDGAQLPDYIVQAREILTQLLSAMNISATVEVVPYSALTEGSEGPPLALNIKGEDLGILIGRRGQTLAALQYIVNLILFQKTRGSQRVIVDVEEYEQRRYKALQALALKLAEQVKRNRRSVTMEPMPANERRIIHLTLAKMPDITTESTGEGENRKVIIAYKRR